MMIDEVWIDVQFFSISGDIIHVAVLSPFKIPSNGLFHVWVWNPKV